MVKIGNQQASDLEELWKYFIVILIEPAGKVAGKTSRRSYRSTVWWNKELKQEIKIKKPFWKSYLNDKREEYYSKYIQETRKKVKEKVAEAKEKAWKDFGNKM